ncbi:FAD-binding oxidoreductase [Nannocystaceae bacterium ST9]
MIDADVTAALRSELGPEGLIESGDDLRFYGSDRSKGSWPVAPGVIALPKTIEQVQAIARLCTARRVAIVPSGGRTGLTGAATAIAGELVLSLARMDRILAIDATSRLLRCEAGVTVQAVQEAAAAQGLMYPVDFAAKGSAQIGGSIATNAGGVKVLRYGLTREWVQALDVVLVDGERLSIGGELVKNNTGYDLRHLFIGSEGTLGIIVGATMKLCRPASATLVALASLPDDDAVLGLFDRLRARSLTLAAFECFDRGCYERVVEHRIRASTRPLEQLGDRQVLIELELADERERETTRDALIELFELCVQDDLVIDATVAHNEATARELWAWREDISESLHAHTPHKADIAVPIREVVAFLRAWRRAVGEALPEIEALVFGHVGDGNLHLNLLRPPGLEHAEFLARCHRFDPQMYGLVREHGGSVSAEHGIGLLKREYLGHTRSAREIALMRAIKQSFDPLGLLNPGKLFMPPTPT